MLKTIIIIANSCDPDETPKFGSSTERVDLVTYMYRQNQIGIWETIQAPYLCLNGLHEYTAIYNHGCHRFFCNALINDPMILLRWRLRPEVLRIHGQFHWFSRFYMFFNIFRISFENLSIKCDLAKINSSTNVQNHTITTHFET